MYFDAFTLSLSLYALITLVSVSWFALKGERTPCTLSVRRKD